MALDPKETLKSVGLGARPKQKRSDKVADAIFQELSILLLGKVRDSELSGVSFSRVEVTDDLKLAKIYFTVFHGSKEKAGQALKRARGFMRSHLATLLNMRYTPDLHFYYDEQVERLADMEKLFREIADERKQNE